MQSNRNKNTDIKMGSWRGFLLILLVIIAFGIFRVQAQPQAQVPISADSVLDQALGVAKKEHKKVMLLFHASWCGWCKKMDASMEDPSCKKYFDSNFVRCYVTVMERGDKIGWNNPGGDELMEKWHGSEQGIPFWLIFDENGRLLADSKMRKENEGIDQGQNMGCPADQQSVDYFIQILRKTTSLDQVALKAIGKRFLENQPLPLKNK